MKPIELCQYTLKHSLNDTGEYEDFKTASELLNAQDIVEDSENGN